MNCSGMQITLPSPDGQNQIITGPYQIKMQLAHNSSPPIQGTEGLTKIEHYRTFQIPLLRAGSIRSLFSDNSHKLSEKWFSGWLLLD